MGQKRAQVYNKSGLYCICFLGLQLTFYQKSITTPKSAYNGQNFQKSITLDKKLVANLCQ